MRINPLAEALRLITQIDPDFLPDLARDPIEAIEVLFDDITISSRPPLLAAEGCAVDGTYSPGHPARIEIANDVTPARQRFTALHELGHHLVELDGHLNDMDIADADRRDEEICNEIAASILIPAELVDRTITVSRVTAEEVLKLHAAVEHASRAACCVAAVRRLSKPGCVILGHADGTAEFIAHQTATPWRIARGTRQGGDSLLAQAARSATSHARGVTQVTFANGRASTNVHGDAYCASDGWVFMVVVADTHSPWVTSLNFGTPDTGAPTEVVECPRCDHAFTAWWAPCRTCGDHKCPQCRKCSCGPSSPSSLRCVACGQTKLKSLFPGQGPICVDCT